VASVLGTDTPEPADAVGGLLAARLPEIPGARWASITQRHGDAGFVTVAASADIARQIDDVQYELGDGPCLQAIDGVPVAVDAEAFRVRWPELATRVIASTVRAMLSQPLSPVSPHVALGSLNLYSERSERFVPAAVTAAADVAAVCGLALVALAERARADHLLVALESSRQIGAAIGIVMARFTCTYEQGFAVLRTASQRTHRKLRDVAEEVVFTGDVPQY
jgi:ANTAR domain